MMELTSLLLNSQWGNTDEQYMDYVPILMWLIWQNLMNLTVCYRRRMVNNIFLTCYAQK